MDIYVKLLFFAIPTFTFLIVVEMVFAKIKGMKINHSADMISSLSSGLSNTIKDAIKFGFAIISYSWFVDHLTIYKLKIQVSPAGGLYCNHNQLTFISVSTFSIRAPGRAPDKQSADWVIRASKVEGFSSSWCAAMA